MKNKSIIYTILIAILCCFSYSSKAQWWQNFLAGTGTTFNQPDNTLPNLVESIGIGDFKGNSAVPQSALDIVIPYLPTPSYSAGEAIHTTAEGLRVDHAWRMYDYNASTGVST